MLRAWLLCILVTSATAAAPPLSFRIDEGQNINSFVREGDVAAHVLLRSGNEPRILVAFPAGNSGVGLWFAKTAAPVTWNLLTPPKPVTQFDQQHRALHGVEFEASVNVDKLDPSQAVLSSIRVLRDYELRRTAPAEVLTSPEVGPRAVSWRRNRLDGAAGYLLSITAEDATDFTDSRFTSSSGAIRLRIRALTGEVPLTPLVRTWLPAAAPDARARNVLSFLAYREKLLAGSWRFDTYFGRDTEMSALLLAPVLTPDAVESAISSVLDRLAPDGEVAHEEDIGEFAVLRNAREGRGRVATPIYDYGMIDDDFMLAPLAARWLLADARGRARARAFLEGKGASGETRGAALARNLAWVVARTAAFAREPTANHLVGVKPGRRTGDWRDSEDGLGGGRYAYDVNAALVPAALDAISSLVSSGILTNFLTQEQATALGQAADQASVWTEKSHALFDVDIPAARVHAAVESYAKELEVDPNRALGSVGEIPTSLHALSLDDGGEPIPILNSDEGFRLLFTKPSPAELERCLNAILRPFPAGLMTDAGLLVANPVLAAHDLRAKFDRFAYHGTVVWSWQQALFAAGIDRQLERADLPESSRTRLQKARDDLWTVIKNNQRLRTSELWSWNYVNGHYQAEPFGRPGADVDESNAAQLWSTVYLGLEPPR